MKNFIKLIPLIALLSGSAFAQDAPAANYRIAANDTLKVSVYDEPELESPVVVAGNGMVTLPLINQIRLAGKTTHEAELAIASAYKTGQFLRSPQVTVTVTAFTEHTVSILGEVGKPGNVVIAGGQTKIELLTAIANAGDFKRIAQKKKIKIKRKQTGKTEVHDVRDMMSEGKGRTIYLYPGDVVVVPQRII